MKYIKLGESDLNVSNIGMGVMRMGTRERVAAAETLRYAVDQGINFFESADVYGGGQSSEKFGQALQDTGISRDQIILQSKGGIVREAKRPRHDFSKAQIIKAVEDELQRFRTDYLDVFLLHRPDALMDPFEVAEAFEYLEETGKVKYFGVSNQNPSQIEILKMAVKQPLIVNQLQFGLMHSGMVDEGFRVNLDGDAAASHDGGVLNYSRLQNMTIQTWSPLQVGYFGGVFIDNPDYPELNEVLQELADKYQVSKGSIAAAWILRHPNRMQVISGAMSPNHIHEMVVASEIYLTRQEWYDLYQAAGNKLN